MEAQRGRPAGPRGWAAGPGRRARQRLAGRGPPRRGAGGARRAAGEAGRAVLGVGVGVGEAVRLGPGLVFRQGARIEVGGFHALTRDAGWEPRPDDKVSAALQGSYLVTSLHLEEEDAAHSGEEPGELVGVARVTGDGVFNATLWDVMVNGDMRGQGLGKALVELTIRALLQRGISNVSLFADPTAIEFYEPLGFKQDPEGIKAMFWYPRRFALDPPGGSWGS